MNAKQQYPDPPVAEAGKVYPVQYTEAQWKERLTADQYYILRQEGTERAYYLSRFALHDARVWGLCPVSPACYVVQ